MCLNCFHQLEVSIHYKLSWFNQLILWDRFESRRWNWLSIIFVSFLTLHSSFALRPPSLFFTCCPVRIDRRRAASRRRLRWGYCAHFKEHSPVIPFLLCNSFFSVFEETIVAIFCSVTIDPRPSASVRSSVKLSRYCIRLRFQLNIRFSMVAELLHFSHSIGHGKGSEIYFQFELLSIQLVLAWTIS